MRGVRGTWPSEGRRNLLAKGPSDGPAGRLHCQAFENCSKPLAGKTDS